jgi:hypothetical protein
MVVTMKNGTAIVQPDPGRQGQCDVFLGRNDILICPYVPSRM